MVSILTVIFVCFCLLLKLGLLHDRHLFAILCGLVCLDMAYLAAWEITDPISSGVKHLSKVSR